MATLRPHQIVILALAPKRRAQHRRAAAAAADDAPASQVAIVSSRASFIGLR